MAQKHSRRGAFTAAYWLAFLAAAVCGDCVDDGSEEEDIPLLVSIVGAGVFGVLVIACCTCCYLRHRDFQGTVPPAPAPLPPPRLPPPPDRLVLYDREVPPRPANAPPMREASPQIKRALDKLFAAAKYVGEGSRDCPPGPWRTLRCVAAWELEIAMLQPGYDARRRQIHMQLSDVCTEKFGGSGIPGVTTEVDEFREGLGLRHDLNETFLFHGTKMDKLLQIVHTGVSARLVGGLFGAGAHLAENFGKTDQYVSPLKKDAVDADSETLRKELFEKCGISLPTDEKIFFVIVCKVLLGFPVYTTDGRTAMDNPPTTTFLGKDTPIFAGADRRELIFVPDMERPIRYHSLIAELGGVVRRFREFIIYDDRAILPSYIAAYVREAP